MSKPPVQEHWRPRRDRELLWFDSYDTNCVVWIELKCLRVETSGVSLWPQFQLWFLLTPVNWLVIGSPVSRAFYYEVLRLFADIRESCHGIAQFNSHPVFPIFLPLTPIRVWASRAVSFHVGSRPKCCMHLSFLPRVFHVLFIAASLSHDNGTLLIVFALFIRQWCALW
jgi:hypothetical protein